MSCWCWCCCCGDLPLFLNNTTIHTHTLLLLPFDAFHFHYVNYVWLLFTHSDYVLHWIAFMTPLWSSWYVRALRISSLAFRNHKKYFHILHRALFLSLSHTPSLSPSLLCVYATKSLLWENGHESVARHFSLSIYMFQTRSSSYSTYSSAND